jgi:uracil-DNA glycosylase family 4
VQPVAGVPNGLDPRPAERSEASASASASALGRLAAAQRGCLACPQLVLARNQVVPGEFPGSASLLLVGEAPGREEDLTGRPFAGRAGRLLDELLDEAGMPRPTVAVTNVLRCRPPANRAPRAVEVDRCTGWLEQEIHLAAPLVVVTLGVTAARWALGRPVRLSEIRGQDHLLGPAAHLPTFHPAAALRTGPAGSPRRALAEDLATAVRRCAELAAGGLALGTVGPRVASQLRQLAVEAFATLPELQPPSGVFRETVDQVAAALSSFPGVAAYRNRRLVAGARLAERDGALWLQRVAVRPAEQGRGVGRALVAWTQAWAVARGYRTARLGVRAQLEPAAAFWTSCGYRPVADHGFWIEYARELG